MVMSGASTSDFVSKIMEITASAPMGGASTGIFGTAGVGDPIANKLKRTAVMFAAEYDKNPGGSVAIRLAKEIEGLLTTLQVLSVITDKRYRDLIADLQGFDRK